MENSEVKEKEERFPYLENNKVEFKIKAAVCIHEWDFPFIQSMEQTDFILANELRKQFNFFKSEMIKSINLL